MAGSSNKTVAGSADANAFIAAIGDEAQRADAQRLSEMMTRLSGETATMWGPSIVGFGSYHYRYESGREGDMCRIGFSPRKGQTVVYLIEGFETHADRLARLGRHKLGKSCLYIKRLSDVDLSVLEEMVAASLAEMAVRYPH